MVLDRRQTFAIAQALLRARNKTDGNDVFENVAQTGIASDDGSFGDNVDMAKARHLQAIHGRPLKANGAYSPDNKPAGRYLVNEALDLTKYQATDTARARPVEFITQMGFGGTGTYQGPEDTKSDFNDPSAPVDSLRRRLSGHDGTAKASPRGHPVATLRQADGESVMSNEAPHREKKMPEVRHVTAGEMALEFLGGIGKGIAQALSDAGIDIAKARRARGGVYLDVEKPDLFGPPTSPWDDTGRKTAPAVMAVTRPVPPRPKTWNGKIIGRVKPPTHLKPGTVPFGNYMHEKIAEFLTESYPQTTFHIRVNRGQTGSDMEYDSGLKTGSRHMEFKSNKPHSQRQLKSQIQNWGYEEETVRVFTYDEQGNIYDGFGK